MLLMKKTRFPNSTYLETLRAHTVRRTMFCSDNVGGKKHQQQTMRKGEPDSLMNYLLAGIDFLFTSFQSVRLFYPALKFPMHDHQRQKRMRRCPKFTWTNGDPSGLVGQKSTHSSSLSPEGQGQLLSSSCSTSTRGWVSQKGWTVSY